MTTADNAVVLDTNVLLSATAPKRNLHDNALRALNEWPNHGNTLCTSGQILREYLVVASRPIELNGLGLSSDDAMSNVEAFLARMRFLDETRAVFDGLRELQSRSRTAGKRLHDAHVVATALTHGVSRVLTENMGDFERFTPFATILSLAEA